MVRADMSREDDFRHLEQKDWFVSAMPLLKTRYRSALVSGLVQSVGSQVVSVVSVPTSAHIILT